MNKPIWLICGDQSLGSVLEERLHSAEGCSGRHCPPDRNDENGWSCRKSYPHGCCGCWAEWWLKNIEFVKDGVPE